MTDGQVLGFLVLAIITVTWTILIAYDTYKFNKRKQPNRKIEDDYPESNYHRHSHRGT